MPTLENGSQRKPTNPATGRPRTPCALLAGMAERISGAIQVLFGERAYNPNDHIDLDALERRLELDEPCGETERVSPAPRSEREKSVVEKFWDILGESRENILRRAGISSFPSPEWSRAYLSDALKRRAGYDLEYLPTGYEFDPSSVKGEWQRAWKMDIEKTRTRRDWLSMNGAALPKALVVEAIDRAILISRNPAIEPAYAEKMRARATDLSPANVAARKHHDHERIAFNPRTTLAERKAGKSAPRQSSELTITDGVLANTALDILMDDERIPQSIRDYLREARHPLQDGIGGEDEAPIRQRCRDKNNLFWAILEYLSAVPPKSKERRSE